LLVLDNCEHLPSAAPSIVELLAACPELTVLATSRASLHVSGEHQFQVPPLELPRLTPLPDLAALAEVPSVQLFVHRARSAWPDFSLSTANARAIAEVCVRLDGLPLAIELAAARSRLLEPNELLLRLERRLSALASGPRDLAPRQRTLRSAIAWSYDLLSVDEQRQFRRLGVFVGGCTLDAAEAIASDPHEPAASILDGVASLLDRNLLRSESDSIGETRVGMLETIREFALEQVTAAAELNATQQRHAAYFADLAEQAAPPRLDGPDGPALLVRLEREHDNLRAALSWLIEYGGAEQSLRMAGALWGFWEVHGNFSEATAWLEIAMAQDQAWVSAQTRARALLGAATLYRDRGDYASALPFARESLSIRRRLGDPAALAEALIMLADMIAISGGDAAESIALATESLTIRQQRGDAVGTVWSMYVLGAMAMYRADFKEARAFMERALAYQRGQADNIVESLILRSLGVMSHTHGDGVTARRLLDQASALLRERGDSGRSSAATVISLGDVVSGDGQPAAGRALLERGLAHMTELGDSLGIVIASVLLGTPPPDGLLSELGEPLFTAGWRHFVGRDLPTGSLTEPGAVRRSARPLARTARATPPDPLTAREREVLQLLARRASNREIADELVLSVRTVERHVANIYAKLAVSGRRQVAAYARQRGWLSPD
jgi:predicted ATPase/DNA-binding CsgD family transcriptional regulator